MEVSLELLKQKMTDFGISLSETQVSQFMDYFELLTEKNKVMNLTAITEFNEVIEKHFLDSLSLYKVYDLNGEQKVLDMGTGAGFPGIPLKIVFPHLSVVLADSLNKRILFLKDVIARLGLERIEAVHGRAEEMARNSMYREQFDLCVSRAVANLSTLSEYCIPFLRIGGTFVSYKSGEIEEEAKQAEKAIFLTGGKCREIYKFALYQQKRSFILIDKVKKTPKGYPRKAGLPGKMPL